VVQGLRNPWWFGGTNFILIGRQRFHNLGLELYQDRVAKV